MDRDASSPSQQRLRGASLGLPASGPGSLASFGTRVIAFVVDALIAAVEDQSLSREHRKRAVFWLAQSKSDAAQTYLEKVLAVD